MTRITSGNNGITVKYSATHRGVDIAHHSNEADNNVLAHSDGTVVWIQTGQKKDTKATGNKSYGNCVKIKHANGYYTLYAHLRSVKVKLGERVTMGQIIGVIGETGRAFGRHLHFELRNTKDVRIDPTGYINSDLPFLNTLKKGKYKLAYEKYCRKTPEVRATNKVLYARIDPSLQPNFIKDKSGYAKYRVGAPATVTSFAYDKKGNVWAKTINTYFCIEDSTGAQAIKI